MNVFVIGVGLIGGSLCYALREHEKEVSISGYDSSRENLDEAIKLGIIDKAVELKEGAATADLIIVAAPVSISPMIAVKVLNNISPKAVVIDVGSIKEELCEVISQHTSRGRFVATHPMWGTEFSGPKAAVKGGFKGAKVVICEKSKSDKDALEFIEKIYGKLGMNMVYMEAEEHDLHTAYVSHISHITSFALALTVLEKEREEQHILDLAATGFASTVRLAKSSPSTWVPIILNNRFNVLDVLREHIHQLQLLRKAIERGDSAELGAMFSKANEIGKILK
ncbi:MAG: prephenate dehydrogenase [Rikenellaceae bacterium]